MKVQLIKSFEELQAMCRQMDAPVFPRHKKRSSAVCFVRRNHCTVEDVENFFAVNSAL